MANINAQFNYSANFGPVIGQMQKLTAEANLLNNTLQNLDKQAVGLKTSLATSFASDLGKIGGWNAKMVELTDSVDQFGQSLLKQKLTLKQYAQEAIGAFTKSSNAHKLAVREVAREMSQLVTLGKGMDGKQMGMMITPATINLRDFNTQMAVSQKQWSIFNSLVQDGTTHLINFGKNTQWAGRQITVGLTVPLTIYGNAVSKIFREVDAELTRFKKVYGSDLMNSTSDATDQMVSDVRNLAVEFSKSFGIAAKETASLAADLAATGLEGQKLLASLRETTRLAVLGDVSNQDAMKTTLSLQNAFKISTDELAESVNFLNAVENQTSLSLQDLTTAIPKAGPVIKSLGGDVKDLSLLMVALKEGGISAAEGANALKSGMASLINPTKQASATAKQYGIDINQIVQTNRGQLMPTIMAFQQQLELLDDFGKAQVIENVFGKYQFARLSALFDNLNASASQTNAVLGLMGQSSKELAATAYQEMDTLMNSSSKRFQRAIEGIKAQFITVGEAITTSITPILENLTGKIGKAIEFFQNLPKPIKSFIKVAVGLSAVAGPIIMMVGIFSNFLGYVGKGAMGMVNLGRRMAGLPTQKFEMLSDTQIMAAKATEQLTNSFDVERSSVERLNQALGLYRQNLVEAINLNPAFLNRQVASATATIAKPPTVSGLDVAGPPAKLQSGGSAFVPGSGNGDKVPAMLEPGEYVVNKKAAAKYSGTLDQMNFQSAPRFQKGGRMPGYASRSFPGVPTVDVNPFKLVGMGGVNEDNPIAGLDRQSGMFYKQISNNRGINTNAMVAEAVFSQLYRSGLFGSNVTGIDQRVYNANTGNKTMPVLGSSFVQGLKTGEKLFDSKSAQPNRPTPFAKGVVNKKAIEGMLASQILGNADTHSGNFGISSGKIVMLDNTANLFTDATGNQRRTSKALNDFSYNPDTAGLDRAGTQAYGKMGSKKADSHVIGYLNSVLGNLNSGNYIAQSINLATQGSPELLKNLNNYAIKKSGGASKSYQELLTSMISMRTQKLMQEFYLDEDDMSLVGSDTKRMRLQSNAEQSYREPFQKTDKEYETIYKWIAGELDYFRRRKNVKGRWTDSEKFDAERYTELLGIMRSVPEGTKMMRGSLLNPGMSGEMSKESQLAMLTAIQTGNYGSLYGMDISFNDFASFASDNMGAAYGPRGMKGGVSRFSASAYRKLYRGVHNRDTEKGRFFDDIERSRATGKESKYGSSPVMYDFTAGPNTQGRDISMGDPSTGAPYPKYRDSWVKEVPDQINEILTYRPQGTITGVSSDLATRQPIIHVQGKQSGGRINGYAAKSARFGGTVPSGYAFAHIVNPVRSGQGLVTLPFGLSIPSQINTRLAQNRDVDPKSLAKAFRADIAEDRMAQVLGIYGEKDPSGIAQSIQSGIASRVERLKGKIGDQDVYSQAKNMPQIKSRFKKYLESGKFYDTRARMSDKGLMELGWAPITDKTGKVIGYSKDGRKIITEKRSSYVAYKDPKTKKSLGYSTGTDTINSRDPFSQDKMSWLEQEYLGMQSGGRINGYATETTSWAKKAASPKAYAGVLQGIPNWATKPAEYEAIVSALRAAGIPESDRLASYYIRDVLAHINPSTTNANGVYEKVWAAANLMKDSEVYNVFLETLNSRKDIGGLLNPSTVSRVAAASGLPVPVVQAELTKMADGVHPNTANGARVMMTLARLFPSRTSPGMPIAVAAGMEARLKGNFYDTLGQRALPSNLPNVTVRSYDPKGTAAPTSSGQGSKVRSTGLIMPSGAIRPGIVMPNIQSISSAAGGMGTGATVKVDGMGNVLSNGIDDMVANTVTGHPIAVSSKELLAVSGGGLIAGVTSPGDEARGKIVHPMGTALMRGKDFQEKRINGFAGKSMTEPVYDRSISGGSMGQFGGNAFMMISVMQQMGFALNQFTSDAQNGGSKFVAAMNLALTATQMMGSGVGNALQGIANARKQNLNLISGLDVEGPKLDNRGKEMTKMSTGIGKLAGVAGKGMSLLGSLPVQIGLQVGIMAVTKTIELYQKAMVNAKKAGNAAFGEPTESAKLLGIELKSLTSGAEMLGKAAEKIFGAQGKGSYDKAFEKVVKTDYQDLINIISKAKTEQEQLNQLTNVYANLIQRGFDPKNAKELTAEIARQSQAMGAFNQASSSLDNIKNSKDAVKAQLETFQSQMVILEERRKLASGVGAKDVASLALGTAAMVPGVSLLGRATSSALGSGIKTQSSDLRADAINEFFGVQGDEFWKKALRGTGLDRNPIAQALGGFLADQTMKTQMAAQLGATIKSIFSIAADNPTASNEALRMLVAQFKTVDWKKASEELAAIAEEKGYGDLSQIGTFIQSDQFKNMAEENQTIFLAALNAGLGPELEKALTAGWDSVDYQKIGGQAAENLALAAIDIEVDIQLKDSVAQMELLKTAIQESFTAAIEAKQKELEFEDKRHEKTLKNLELESQRLQLKKETLAKNTEYYIKELQKEKEAEDYYARQRQTGLSGLKAISQGDVFGFIGAQMDAATTADQFGRERSIQNIQDTSDAAQAKIDQELKGIEDRKAAEDARHEAEVKNINAEMEFLQQKQSASVGSVEKATKLLEKAMAMSPGDKGYQQAVTDAVEAAQAAGASGQQVMQELKITSADKDIQTRIDSASKSLGEALTIIANDTTNAVDRLNDAGIIASNVFESLGIDPAKSKAYKDLFDTLQKPLDPTVSAAIQAFTYGSVNNQQQGTLDGPDLTNQDGSTTTTYKKNTVAVRGKTPYSPVTKADGGMLYGPGTGTSDSIPIMASNGEYVLRADVVRRIGKTKLDQINAGNFAVGGLVGSMPSMSSAPGMAAGGFVGSSAPTAPKYNIPTAGVSASPSPIAQMAGGGMVGGASASHSAPTTNFHFNGAGMDMVMHHVNKQMGGRINSNSRRIG
jgi:TP901 family phage tail tape measure protein